MVCDTALNLIVVSASENNASTLMHANDADKVRTAPFVVHGDEMGMRIRALMLISLSYMILFFFGSYE